MDRTKVYQRFLKETNQDVMEYHDHIYSEWLEDLVIKQEKQLLIHSVVVPKGTLPCDICGSNEQKKFDNPSCECVPNHN